MLAPLATLAFLTVLWLVNLAVADMLNRDLVKISAAVRGQSVLATAPAIHPVAVRVSQRSRGARTWQAQPRLRAAA